MGRCFSEFFAIPSFLNRFIMDANPRPCTARPSARVAKLTRGDYLEALRLARVLYSDLIC